MIAPTVEPVTTSGWYEETDGTIAEYAWRAGQLVRGRAVASWADVPERVVGEESNRVYSRDVEVQS